MIAVNLSHSLVVIAAVYLVALGLLSKSLNMSSEVYLSMKSRGFHGRVVTLKFFEMKKRIGFGVGCCCR